MIEDLILDGGVRLLVETTAAAEVAAVGVWYGRGSRDEGSGEGGATHVVEHMLFKGTMSLTASDIARRFDALGGAANAFTERECMGIHAVVPVEAFEEAVLILSSLVNDASFDGTEFERELSVIANELEASEDDPEEAAADAFSVRLWPNHPAGRKIGGEKNEVARFRRDDIYGFYESRFRGSPSLIGVAGGISAERALRAFNTAGFRTPPALVQDARNPPFPADPRGPVFHTLPVQYVQVFYGMQVNGHLEDTAYYPLEVANAAFGDTMGSRLFQELRERRGLCYSVYSMPNLFDDFSFWSAYATCSASDSAALVEAVHREVRRAAANGFTSEEIDVAKAHLRGMMKIAAQDVEYRMRRLARQALFGSPILTVDESLEAVASVTTEAASDALSLFLRKQPLVFAAGNRRAGGRFSREADKIRSEA